MHPRHPKRSGVEDTIWGLRHGVEDVSDCISIGCPALLSALFPTHREVSNPARRSTVLRAPFWKETQISQKEREQPRGAAPRHQQYSYRFKHLQDARDEPVPLESPGKPYSLLPGLHGDRVSGSAATPALFLVVPVSSNVHTLFKATGVKVEGVFIFLMSFLLLFNFSCPNFPPLRSPTLPVPISYNSRYIPFIQSIFLSLGWSTKQKNKRFHQLVKLKDNHFSVALQKSKVLRYITAAWCMLNENSFRILIKNI
nr:uncharacterized protein LOC112307160 isoform X2 [Desmodus rotundus]